jgi:hypothetical protein
VKFLPVLFDSLEPLINTPIVQLNATHLSEYQPRKEGFKQLVLPPGHAELIEALIKTRYLPGQDKSRRETFTADVVRGKGKGLIILLHGAPGVGKTSTAGTVLLA